MTTAAQTRGGGPWHLLEVIVDGRPIRATDRPGGAVVVDPDGVSLSFAGGLSADASARSLGEAVEVAFTAWVPGVAVLVARGAELLGSPARVWRWYEGTRLDQAVIVVVGELEGPTYGADWEPLTGTVRAPMSGAGLVPDPGVTISALRWPVRVGYTLDPEAIGATSPLIIGRPGAIAGGVDAASSPAYLVELATAPANLPQSRLEIAHHPVAATSVTLHDVSGKTSAVRTVSTTTDATGRTVSYVDFVGLNPLTEPFPEEGREYRIAWDQGGGGIVDPSTGLEVRGAGTLIGWLARTYAPSFTLDSGRQDAQRAALDRYLLDMYIADPVDALDLVRDVIARWLPVRMVASRDGYAWEFRPPRAWRGTAVAVLDSSPRGAGDLERVSSLGYLADGLVSSVSLEYAKAGSQQRPTRRVTLDSASAYVASVGAQRRPGRAATGSLPHVCDDATAANIAADILEANGYPRRVVDLQGPITYDRLEPGDGVLWTDSSVGVVQAPAWVESVLATSERSVELRIVLDDHPTNRSRS